jgi:hypothetical protein
MSLSLQDTLDGQKKTMTVRVGRERVKLTLGRRRWSGEHSAGVGVYVERENPEENDLGMPWSACVGGRCAYGSTAQAAVNEALIRFRDKIAGHVRGAESAIERCEHALAQAKANAPARAKHYRDLLEAVR